MFHCSKIWKFGKNTLKKQKQKRNQRNKHTWDRAHSRTVIILSWSGWKHIPTSPIGCGSVTEVGKFPSQSNLPNKPFHWLCLLAVFGKHQGIKSAICPVDSSTSHLGGYANQHLAVLEFFYIEWDLAHSSPSKYGLLRLDYLLEFCVETKKRVGFGIAK